jgi:hypothetical protein
MSESYEDYGGRGITYDPSWNDFSVFLADMGDVPEGLTLDRKDPNGNYNKENCHWADWFTQAANKRQCGTKFITYNGRTQAPSAWAEELGISVSTIYTRRRRGWSVDQILNGRLNG